MSATVSLLGLSRINGAVLSELVVPDGIDVEVVKDNLLAETAELEVIYPDAIFMQAMIGRWSAKELPVWEKLYATTQFDYNPIENYNRTEKWTEDENTTKNTDSEATGSSKTESDGTSKQHRENEIEHAQNKYVSAYNETDFTPTERTQDSQQELGDTTQEDEGNVNVTAKSGNVTDETGKRLLDRSGQARGNIGVTTTQTMITQEREVDQFNVIDYIIDSFKKRFCLLVY